MTRRRLKGHLLQDATNLRYTTATTPTAFDLIENADRKLFGFALDVTLFTFCIHYLPSSVNLKQDSLLFMSGLP